MVAISRYGRHRPEGKGCRPGWVRPLSSMHAAGFQAGSTHHNAARMHRVQCKTKRRSFAQAMPGAPAVLPAPQWCHCGPEAAHSGRTGSCRRGLALLSAGWCACPAEIRRARGGHDTCGAGQPFPCASSAIRIRKSLPSAGRGPAMTAHCWNARRRNFGPEWEPAESKRSPPRDGSVPAALARDYSMPWCASEQKQSRDRRQ